MRRNPALIVLALALAIAPLSLAQRGHGRGPLERLELTDAQRSIVEPIFEAHHEWLDGFRPTLHEARQALEAQIHAEGFDESAIRQAAVAVAELEADRAVRQAEVFEQLRRELTPEQLDKIKMLRSGRGEGRGMRGGPPHRSGGGHGHGG